MEDQRKTKAQLIEELRKLRKKYESLCRAGDPSVSEDPEFRIDSFYDSIQAGIILQSSDGEIIHTNTYASKIFNMPADKVTGRSSMDPVWNMVDEQEQPVAGKDHPSMITLRTGKPLRDVIRGIFSTDPSRMRWLLINTLPIFKKSAKKPSEVMTTFIDITEQKNLEKQAREDQRILSMMARNYPNSYVSIIEKDLSIGFTAGQEFSKQNLDPEDFIGLKIEDVFGEHTREVQNYYLKTFDGEEQEFQLFINGQHQLYRTVPLVNDDGDTGRIMVVVENITEKVEAEESARESFRRYQLLFETSSDAIFIADPETGMMIDCNPAAEQLTGRTSEELRSLHQFDLHPPEKSDFYKSEFAKAVKSKGLLFEGMEILHKDGRRIPVEISSGGIALNRDTSLHYGIFRDVSERLASEKKIAREQENLSALINNTDGMIWSVDRDFRLIVGNAAFNNSVSSLSERPLHPGDLVLTDDFPESARETWRNMYQRSLEGESFAVEMPPEFGNKDSVIEFRLSPIFSGEGKITGVTVFGRDVSEQKKSEDELAASREKYQLIVDNQNDLVVQITPDLRILYASPSYCRTFGQDEANLIGRTFTPKIHKDDREAVKKSLARLSQEPYKTQHDERALTVDGWRHFTWSARAILDDNGKISSIISVGRDITDRAETREQLSASEEKYRLYFEHSPVGYQSLDENGCILDVNHTWLNLLGYTKEEVRGKWFGDFLHPEEKELFRERFPINIQSNETIRDMVFRLRLKDGSYLIAEYTARIGRDKDGSFQRTHCVFQDISERIKAEASLKESEIKFRSYIENSPYGIFLWDGEGRFQDVNAAACKISGFAYRDLLNLSITDLVPEENKTEVLDEFKNLIDRGCSSIEIPFLTKSGKTIFCSIDSVRTGPDKYLGFVQDVTARKVSRENAIRTANEWQTTFDASEDVIWILDREQRIARSNRKARDYFGKPPEQLIGMHCWEIAHEEGRPIEGCPILKARNSMGRESMDLSVGDKWFKVTVDPIMDEQMRFNGAVHVISDITERKAAEEALILAKNSLEEAQAVSHTGSWEYDFEKDQPAWSKEAYKIFGIDPDQPPPSWVEHKKLLYPSHWEILDKAIEQCVKYGQPYSQEFKLFRPDGKVCWAETVGRAVKDENGNITKLMGTIQDITSRKLAELERNREREKAAAYLDIAKVMFVQLNADGTVGMVNPKACEVLGYREEDITGKDWFENFIPEVLRNDVLSVFNKIISGEMASIDTYENPVLCKDGQERLISWHNTQIFDDKGKIIGILGSGDDVTEERESKRQLFESLDISKRLALENEEFFKSAQQVLTLGSFEKTARSLFDSCRKMTGAVSGYVALLSEDGRENELLFLEDGGLPCSVNPDLPMPIRGLRERCYLEGRATWDNDFMNSEWIKFMPEGHVVLNNVLFSPLNISGRTVGIIGLANKPGNFDEHDARVAETLGDMAAIALNISKTSQSLQESEKWSRDIINASPDALLVLDENRNITEINNTALSFYGYTRPEFLSMNFDDLAVNRDTGEKTGIDERPFRNVLQSEALHRSKDGSQLEVEIHTSDLESDNGKNLSLASVRDITKRKQDEKEREKLQEQLTQAQKMESIGRLAGGVAHDFNNLLTAIQGFSELLQSSLSPGDPLKKDVEEIQKAADSASSLTSQLLTFSRKQVAAPKILDLNSKISSSEKMLRRIIGEDIKFIFHPGKDAGNVFIDPGQVDQILINLMVNSRDAMPEGGELSITTGKVPEKTVDCHSCGLSLPGNFVMFSVTDTGTGMDEETLRNIFEPFYTTKETGKGTGLGMSTIHGIIHQNRGHIKIDSLIGKGSTFRIYLPSREGKAETPTAVEPDFQAVCSETVLLVEDKEIVRKLVLRILKKQGYKVIEAANGGEAFLKFEQENQDIDLLLTDVIMPEMSGKQLYERLLKIKPDLKALFMSGYTEDSISSQGILEEKINFIQKPFRPQALAAKLREVIGTEK